MIKGYIRKRESGNGNGHVWQIVTEYPQCPATGKRKRVYKTVSGTKDEANYILGQILADFADTDNAIVVL